MYFFNKYAAHFPSILHISPYLLMPKHAQTSGFDRPCAAALKKVKKMLDNTALL